MKQKLLFILATSALSLCAAVKPIGIDLLDYKINSDLGWCREGDEICNLTKASHIFVTEKLTPHSRDYTFEMSVKPTRKVTRTSDDVGVSISSPMRGIVWDMKLVDNNKRRYAELGLSSRRRTVNENNAKITCVNGRNFSWEYNHTYRIRVSKKGRNVTGTVFYQGKEVVKYTAIDNSDEPYTGAFYAGRIYTRFSKPAAEWGEPVKVVLPKPKLNKPKYVPFRNISKKFKAEATGFFYTKQDETGRWWFIDPAGNGFFACAVDAVSWGGRASEELGYSTFKRYNQARFGSEKEYILHTRKVLDDWGFNSAGTCMPSFTPYIPFSCNLMIGSTFASRGDDYNICPYLGSAGSPLPNPFHPRFGEYAKERFMMKAGKEIENPYFIGYFCDNELKWAGNPMALDGSGLFNTVMKKRAGHTAKIALIKFIREKANNNIDEFNKFWGTNFNSFDEIANAKALDHKTPEQLEVKKGFLALAADTYFKTIRDSIKEIDKNHLFLGCRYAGVYQAHEIIWKANAKYCDVVTFNMYPTFDRVRNQMYGKDSTMTEIFDRLYKLCGKPMMVTEWAFMGLDSELPCTIGAGQRFYTQAERAEAAKLFYKLMLSHKSIIGSVWYQFADSPQQGIRRKFPENSNYGIFNKYGKPYRELVEAFKEVNQDIDAAREYIHVPNKVKPAGNLYNQFNLRTPSEASKKMVVKVTKNTFKIGNGTISISSMPDKMIKYVMNGKRIGQICCTLHTNDKKHEFTRFKKIKNIKAVRLQNGVELSFTGDTSSPNGNTEVKVRFFVPAKGTYVIGEFIEAKNTGKHSIGVEGFYFKMFANFNFYPPCPDIKGTRSTSFDAIAYESESTQYFGCARSFSRFGLAHFYRKELGTRIDAEHEFYTTLAPGEVFKPAYPAYLFFHGGKGAHIKISNQLRRADMK